MMKQQKQQSLVCLLFLACATLVGGNVLIDAPETYFGGSDDAIATTYTTWASSPNASKYKTSAYFPSAADETVGAAVHWLVDNKTDLLHLAVAARAQDGWVGFGISELGGMKGADFAIFETANPDKVRDAHALEVNFPTDDDCQDWTYVSHVNDGGFLIFEAIRRLNTGDAEDHAIPDDSDLLSGSSRVIAAWSADSPTAAYHGTQNFIKGIVRWHVDGDELGRFQRQMGNESDGFFEIRIPDYVLPMEDDHYVYFCVPWAEFVNQGADPNGTFTVIGVEPLVAHPKNVHHASLLGDPKDILEMEGMDGIAKCPGNGEDDLTQNKWWEIISGFDQATIGNAYPSSVGQLFGPGGDVVSMRFQMHYKNVARDPNVADNSGVRLYYSHTPRPDRLGTMILADPLVDMEGTPLGNGLSRHKYTCPAGCSELFLFDSSITVFQEIFHMHNKGVAVYLDIFRKGQLLKRAGIDVFDDNTQGFPYFRQSPYKLYPGDSFEVSCFYRSDKNTTYGYGADDEMCQAYISYYPKKVIFEGQGLLSCFYESFFPVCEAEVEIDLFDIDAGVPSRGFGLAPDQCAAVPKRAEGFIAPPTTSGGHHRPAAVGMTLLAVVTMLLTF